MDIIEALIALKWPIVVAVLMLFAGIVIGAIFSRTGGTGSTDWKEFPADYPNANWSDAPDERK